ncbi:MAG: hypothetical protein M3176_09750, partial [Chloroflexota bacterium]|nr:hypothetical protein [Chloroflexota bacterium]
KKYALEVPAAIVSLNRCGSSRAWDVWLRFIGALRDFGTKSMSVPFVISGVGRPSLLLVHPLFPLPPHQPRTPYTDDNETMI